MTLAMVVTLVMKHFELSHRNTRVVGVKVWTKEKEEKSNPWGKQTVLHLKSIKQVENGRLCMSAEDIASHFTYIHRTTNAAPCVVCGKNSIWKCDKCGVSVFIMEKRKWNGAKCAFLYHNPVLFGLARNDHTGDVQWQPPTPQVIEKNARKINWWRSGKAATDT
jgi:hypothetical protein